jgi:acyl-CoA synthetase (AMP-forming)/AMP-acid ligase II
MLVSDLLGFAAARWPDAPALIFGERTQSYSELYGRAAQLANALQPVAAKGDRIAILAENCPEYIEAYYGVPMAGMALTFLNYRLHPRELEKIIDHSGATVLITEPNYFEALKAIGVTDRIRTVITVGRCPGAIEYDDFLQGAPTTPPAVDVDEPDLAWLIYTSGTTGPPKGAMLSHRNLVAAVCNSSMAWERESGGITLMPWPLCHVAGYGMLVNHTAGKPVVLMRGYEPEQFLTDIERHGITDISVAPVMLSMLLRHPSFDRFDVSTVRRIGYGAAPMPLEVLRQGMAKFPQAKFFTGFGMTELGGNVLYQTAEAHIRALAGEPELLASVGQPMPLGAVRVVDDDLEDVKAGQIGELVVRAPQVTFGYWGNPTATEEAFAGGWFHSGDLARRDEEGNFYIVDRKKDMIVTGGENVYSREVEEILYQHPAVAEAAVIGEPDKIWGEAIVAVIQTKLGVTVTAEELIALCRENLASYKKPRRVVFVDELPRNAAGKILKRQLRVDLTGA